MASTSEPLVPSFTKKTTISTTKPICITISLASLILLATFIAIQPTVVVNKYNLCAHSANPASCDAIVADAVSAFLPARPRPSRVLHAIINRSLRQLDAIAVGNDTREPALADCVDLLDLLDLSRDRLLGSASAVASGAHTDARTWLSAVLTNHVTCLDALVATAAPSVDRRLENRLDSLVELASASLAILNAVSRDVKEVASEFPAWVTARDRMLLDASAVDAAIEVNVTVAVDGSGDYVTVQEAVDGVPDKGKSRYVIYVKSGTYQENVMVPKSKKNLMIVGDGMNYTVITGDRNVVDGWTTFNSATLAAVADRFILQDICIQNTAGPEKHQAVALRVGADRSVVNRCRISGYHDTLYAHSLRQFYRDCSISGTVDFVFGNAAVVIQKCDLIARLPMSNQKNLVTAQGRTDPNQNTGTSIQDCQVVPSTDLLEMQESIPSYLGRPWKNFSRTVYMQSYISGHINPEGWLEWDGDFALDTLYYGEFENSGPGAGLAGRVNWTGYHAISDAENANNFTVTQLIQGGEWLHSTGVEYNEGL